MGKSDYEKLAEWMEEKLISPDDLATWIADFLQQRRTFPNATPEGTLRLKEEVLEKVAQRMAEWKASQVMTAIAQNPEDAQKWHLPKPETAGQYIYDLIMHMARVAMDEERYISMAEAARDLDISEKSIYNILSFARSHGVDI